ncbi:MAG: DEAD/DEAH box helicase family protein [Candidatus Eremiobacteraeota bacterium]|nr:DEAD/DEAH box helicase family protein [Candidatus Eremiobacteraeota bacterium]
MRGPRLHGWRLPLRAWQRAAFDGWDAGRPNDALIVATPGAGKTRFATRVAHALLRDGAAGRVVVVVPREHLKAQVARAMVGAGIVLDHRFANAQERLARDVHGAVVTYQQVCAAPRLYRQLCREDAPAGGGVAVLLDEIHHAGDDATWGKALRDAFEPASHRVALSGTPFRSDGTAIPFVRYDRGLSVADFAYDYATALRDGVCRALVFALHGGEAEWVARDGTAMAATFDTALREKRHHSERLRTMLTQDAWIGEVLAAAHLRLLSVRAEGHRDAAGLVAAMNQDHARAIASLMEQRLGVRPAIVVSDLADASDRIAAFARSTDPWIVAVHMVSEGVDIPRLRVGVFASNVVTELYFRQFCGRFVRTIDGANDPEAYVFVPDDPRLRMLAHGITLDVRHGLRGRDAREEEIAALDAAQRADRASDAGLYEAIAARTTGERVVDFGPLFNPAAFAAGTAFADGERDADEAAPPPSITAAERKESLRRSLHGLVTRVSSRFNVEHRKVHATLNQRVGGNVATATERELDLRRRVAESWLVRDKYDGLR